MLKQERNQLEPTFLSIVPYARLHKAQKLRRLAQVDFFPVLTFILVVPLFLYLDFGVKTLVYSTIIQVFLRNLYLAHHSVYSFKFLVPNIKRELWSQLLKQYASNFVIYLTTRVDQVVVASFLSIETMGVYSFIKQMTTYPTTLLLAMYTQITFPYYSRYRKNLLKIKKTYLLSSSILIFLTALYYIFIIVIPQSFAENHVNMWGFRTSLALSIMIRSILKLAYDTLSTTSIAIGNISNQLKINILILIVFSISALLIPNFGLTFYVDFMSGISAVVFYLLYKVIFFQQGVSR